MSRSLAASELATLGPGACHRLLASRHLGRLVYVVHGRPHVIPLNYVLDGGEIVVRMDYGDALEQVVSSGAVAFEVDHADFGYHTAWSVVAHGRAEEVTDAAEVERLRRRPLQPWAPGDRARYVRVIPAAYTGRRLT
jgi:uncharacterized protein